MQGLILILKHSDYRTPRHLEYLQSILLAERRNSQGFPVYAVFIDGLPYLKVLFGRKYWMEDCEASKKSLEKQGFLVEISASNSTVVE